MDGTMGLATFQVTSGTPLRAFMEKPLQRYKKSAILARKICDFMFVCAQKVTAGEGFYGLFIFVLVLEQVVGLILFKRQCGLLILEAIT